jgi:hypothetical protein
MPSKLAALGLALISVCAGAQQNPTTRFNNLDAVTAWFSKEYPAHEMKMHAVKIPGEGVFEVYAFYGTRGSGIIRVDGWFYSCTKRSTCDLLAMANLGEARYLKEGAIVTFESPFLIIKSSDSTLIKLKLRPGSRRGS